jgi:hypothetical protein
VLQVCLSLFHQPLMPEIPDHFLPITQVAHRLHLQRNIK